MPFYVARPHDHVWGRDTCAANGCAHCCACSEAQGQCLACEELNVFHPTRDIIQGDWQAITAADCVDKSDDEWEVVDKDASTIVEVRCALGSKEFVHRPGINMNRMDETLGNKKEIDDGPKFNTPMSRNFTGIWDSVGDGEVNGSKMMDINHEKTIKTQKMNDELGDYFAIYDAIMAGGSSTKRPLSRYSRYGKSSEVDENEIDDPYPSLTHPARKYTLRRVSSQERKHITVSTADFFTSASPAPVPAAASLMRPFKHRIRDISTGDSDADDEKDKFPVHNCIHPLCIRGRPCLNLPRS